MAKRHIFLLVIKNYINWKYLENFNSDIQN